MRTINLNNKVYFIFNKTTSTQQVFKAIEKVKNKNPIYLAYGKKRKIAYQDK